MKWAPLGKLRNAVLSFLGRSVPKTARVFGHTMHLDRTDTLGLSLRGVYEPFETQLIRNALARGDVFIDVGAHIGYYTLIAAQSVGAQGRVFAFEPDPENFALLEKNVATNGFTNVRCFRKGVSNKSGTGVLYTWPSGSGGHTSYDDGDAGRGERIGIEQVTLDGILSDLSAVNFVKIDVNGSDFQVLEGMTQLLARSPDARLLIEFTPAALRILGDDPTRCIETLRNLGFRIYLVNEAEKRLEPIDDAEAVNELLSQEGRNLYCLKQTAQ